MDYSSLLKEYKEVDTVSFNDRALKGGFSGMQKSLSICISTYNREKKIVKLVKEILQCESNDFEVVVVDDCSTDNTMQLLNEIKDERLYTYTNSVNQGAKKNWYLSLDKGRGKYIFQLLDRDWIRVEQIIELIQILSDNDIVFGYAGWGINSDKNSEKHTGKVRYYKKGKQGLIKFGGVACHPTGSIFKRANWIGLQNRKKYFFDDKYGIYPHGFIFAELAKIGDSIMIDIDFCDYNRCLREVTSQSRFYLNSTIQNRYWTPEASFWQTILILGFIDKLELDANIKYEILYCRFQEDLQVATEEYRNIYKNQQFIRRYDMTIKKISKLQLLIISMSFFQHYCIIAKKKNYNWLNKAFYKKIETIMWQEMRRIVCLSY